MSEEITSTKTKRKASKPIMEKKRRARINQSLDELKVLILEATRKDVSCHSKLEKADILEMTVRHLKSLRNHQKINNAQREPLENYRAGFNECAGEITRCLASLDGVGVDWKTRLLEHLAASCHGTAAGSAVPKAPLGVPCLPSMPRSAAVHLSSPSVLASLQQKQDSPSIGHSSQFQILSADKIAAILVPTGSPFLMTPSQPSGHEGLLPALCKDPLGTSSPGGVRKEPVSIDAGSQFWRPF